MMDIVNAMDIATRFVDQNTLCKTWIWEEPTTNDGISIEIVDVCDDHGERTCIDLVAYPSNEVLNSRSVSIDNRYEIALAIMEIMNEGARL